MPTWCSSAGSKIAANLCASRYSYMSVVTVYRHTTSPVMLLSFWWFAAGADRWQNGSDVIVDYNTSDPLIRWDSYQNICDGEGTVPSPHDTHKNHRRGVRLIKVEHPSGKRHLLLSGNLFLRQLDAVIISFACFCSIMKTFLKIPKHLSFIYIFYLIDFFLYSRPVGKLFCLQVGDLDTVLSVRDGTLVAMAKYTRFSRLF